MTMKPLNIEFKFENSRTEMITKNIILKTLEKNIFETLYNNNCLFFFDKI